MHTASGKSTCIGADRARHRYHAGSIPLPGKRCFATRRTDPSHYRPEARIADNPKNNRFIMTLEEFKEHVKARKPLDTDDIFRFMNDMSNEA